jgi:hypothetical protein
MLLAIYAVLICTPVCDILHSSVNRDQAWWSASVPMSDVAMRRLREECKAKALEAYENVDKARARYPNADVSFVCAVKWGTKDWEFIR